MTKNLESFKKSVYYRNVFNTDEVKPGEVVLLGDEDNPCLVFKNNEGKLISIGNGKGSGGGDVPETLEEIINAIKALDIFELSIDHQAIGSDKSLTELIIDLQNDKQDRILPEDVAEVFDEATTVEEALVELKENAAEADYVEKSDIISLFVICDKDVSQDEEEIEDSSSESEDNENQEDEKI